MSTPTPTGNGHADHLGRLAPWMLDEATLTRLAGDVLASFAAEALPGLDSSAAAVADEPQATSHLGQPSYYFIDEQSLGVAGAAGSRADRIAADAAFDVGAVRADFPILGEQA